MLQISTTGYTHGIVVSGSYVYLKGLEIANVPMNTFSNNGISASGSNNIFELLNMHHNSGNGIFITSRLPQAFGVVCGADQAARIDATVGAAIRKSGTGLLTYQRTLESIRDCGVLKQAKEAELVAALSAR